MLWDIDHTLIDTRGAGRELSAAAFERVTGIPMRKQAKTDGITESVIFRETAALHGLTTGRAEFEAFARRPLQLPTLSAHPISGSAAMPCPAQRRPWMP